MRATAAGAIGGGGFSLESEERPSCAAIETGFDRARVNATHDLDRGDRFPLGAGLTYAIRGSTATCLSSWERSNLDVAFLDVPKGEAPLPRSTPIQRKIWLKRRLYEVDLVGWSVLAYPVVNYPEPPLSTVTMEAIQ